MKQQMQPCSRVQCAGLLCRAEILKVGGDRINAFLAAEPRPKIYTFYLRDIARRAPHTLTDSEENPRGRRADGEFFGKHHGILASADFPCRRSPADGTASAWTSLVTENCGIRSSEGS